MELTQFGDNKITIYHGSPNIIKIPEFGKGGLKNDYGRGFYTTKNKGLAGEWAVLWTVKDGYINEYILDTNELCILHLDRMDINHWIAILMDNREGRYEDPAVYGLIRDFKKKYLLDLNEFDVIIGWRADDSYFSYVESFALGLLSIENLSKVMKLGNLGQQICLRSKKAFAPENIRFVCSYIASADRFYSVAKQRDSEARRAYDDLMRYGSPRQGTLIESLI